MPPTSVCLNRYKWELSFMGGRVKSISSEMSQLDSKVKFYNLVASVSSGVDSNLLCLCFPFVKWR